MSKPKDTRKRVAIVGVVLFGIGAVNIAAFCTIGLIIGGDAWGTEVEDGRYYLSQHGQLTEVSRAVWIYSYVHVVATLLLGVPITIVGAFMHLFATHRLFAPPPVKKGPDKQD